MKNFIDDLLKKNEEMLRIDGYFDWGMFAAIMAWSDTPITRLIGVSVKKDVEIYTFGCLTPYVEETFTLVATPSKLFVK